MEKRKDQYLQLIEESLENCLVETQLPLPNKRRGKVRDSYELADRMIFITTDRQSAFDRILAAVPYKGQVLNLTSAWWFKQTAHIVPNHLVDVPDPNTLVAKRCEVFPIEFVVRGYITGSTDTSLWTQYRQGVRTYCGNTFPDGLVKNQQLDEPVLTPTTKETEHDRPIAPQEIIEEGWMQPEDWQQASSLALQLFSFGQRIAKEHGLILVDTKYEMGKDSEGNIVLIDEIHTPDSSRFWLAESYEQRVSERLEPENIDKEFLRLWFRENCDPYHDKELPQAPKELVTELSYRYILLYEMITGELFPFPDEADRRLPAAERLMNNLQGYLTDAAQQ
ncbi:MAG: phosphoribosylaminoimidazolesuccinocarboxamide synthase [Spirochaetota bacterium]